MKKTLNFGKIDYNGTGRKMNLVTIEIELKEKEGKGLVFTACGNIWNHIKTDVYCCGQCLDTILKYMPHNKKLKQIISVWNKYHLNDMKAGTPKQEEFIKEWKKTNKYDYTKACEALKEAGLYEDNGYKYGTGWLFEEIPADVIAIIKSW